MGPRVAADRSLAYHMQWDINAVCYGCNSIALVFCALILTGIIGPNLDAHDQTTDKRNRKIAIAATK